MTVTPDSLRQDPEVRDDPEGPESGDISPRLPGIFVRSTEEHVVSFNDIEQVSVAGAATGAERAAWSLSGEGTPEKLMAVADAVRTAGGGLEVRFRGPEAESGAGEPREGREVGRVPVSLGAAASGAERSSSTAARAEARVAPRGSGRPVEEAHLPRPSGRSETAVPMHGGPLRASDAGSLERWEVPELWVDGPRRVTRCAAGGPQILQVEETPARWPLVSAIGLTVGGARERAVRWS